jgi:thiamine pyrophosphate-dependent acetolactate synthase large subunit-like protein
MDNAGKLNDLETPKNAGNFPMDWGSDAIAEMLRRLDLEFVSLNPGASYRGLHDSLVNYLGNENPQMLLCNHEEHAVSIAHGYAKVTGKPMGVIVHSNVGLMHATMAIFDAWCDRVPVIVLGAIGPVDAARRRPWIDWIHTTKDMGALVRNYTKWDDQPGSVAAAMESLLRASLMARTAPKGPVYICLDVAMQEARLEESIPIPDVSRYMPAPPQEVSREAVRGAAELLCRAERPLILAGRVSRSQEAWDCRVRLAESLGAMVMTDIKVGAAFPTAHPLHGAAPGTFLSEKATSLLREADVILSLDWLDLAGTFKQAWGTAQAVGSKVIHCSVDIYNHNGWSMDHQGLPPVDIPLLAEPDLVVPPLLDEIRGLLGDREAVRQEGWGPVRDNQSASVSDATGKTGQMTLYDLARCLKQVLGERETTLIRLPLGWPDDAWDFKGPLDFLGGDGGGGVGSGPGMAVGAALALRNSTRLPVAILGDGDFLMGVNALWPAAHYWIPLLIIIANNRSYFNDEVHQERMARERNRPVENKWIGLRMDDPPVDLAAMARAQGLKGEGPIVDLKDLTDVLARAVKTVEGGEPCVVDVIVTRRT